MREHSRSALSLILVAAVLAGGCQDHEPPTAPTDGSPAAAAFKAGPGDGPYDEIGPAVWDIAAAPDGGILVAQNTSILEIRKDGIEEIATVPTVPGAAVNGIAPIGRGSIFATSMGLDLAEGAGVWHVTNGHARLVGDIQAFETAHDPDALEGPMWKDTACEEDPLQGFTAGPQSNPYHLAMLDGGTALVADAAGNTLLSVERDGTVDWVAVFTPPVDGTGEYRYLKTAESDPSIDCYVQPVPTSVAIGPDGSYWVGELTGAPGPGEFGIGWSRVWRIDPGARHVVCPSTECTMALDGMTAVIDVEFGPEGDLWVVEFDENGFLAAVVPAIPLGLGTIHRCDVSNLPADCDVVASGLTLPGAITFDKWGDAWLLENVFDPTIRELD